MTILFYKTQYIFPIDYNRLLLPRLFSGVWFDIASAIDSSTVLLFIQIFQTTFTFGFKLTTTCVERNWVCKTTKGLSEGAFDECFG
jgi:hypothetical protein